MLDTRQTLLQEIKGRLIVYASLIHAEQGRLSDGAEDFYRGLLSIMLGCELKNMNHERENFPAIDLGDDGKRLCVQVTSTGTRAKVRHTLKEFFENKLHERFDRLIVLVIGDAQKFDTEPKNDVGFDFRTRRDIWDTIGLFREIGKLEDEVLEKIAAYLQKRVNLPKREPLLELTMGSAMPADRFVGRVEELRRIEEELTQNRVAFLSGLGGMGKTELALRYGDDYRVPGWRFVYFVRFKKTFDQTVTDNIAPFIPGFKREGLNEQQILDGAMQHLRRGNPNDLLILDNADDAEESVEQLRRVLQSLPMRVLVTTRAENDTAIGVGSMETETLHEIFRNHKVTISETEMDELIAAVDGHTLTVDLMARLLRRERQSKALQTLRDALGCRDLKNADLGTVDTVYYGNEGQARINEHLKAVFKVANLGAAEQTLLRFASLLPECGLDAEIFAVAAVQKKQKKRRGFFARLFQKQEESPILDTPRKVKDVLQTLADGGWLEWEGDILKIHPVICIVCREELKPTRGNCHAFVKGVWDRYDRKEYDHLRFTQIAELLTNASEILGDPDGWYIGNGGYLLEELGESQRALVCKLRATEILEHSQPDSRNLATSYSNVGMTYDSLGSFAKALEYQQKALAIHQKVPEPDLYALALTFSNMGGSYSHLGDHEAALEYQQEAFYILEKILPPKHPQLASVCNNLGMAYGELGDYPKALEYNLKALMIEEACMPPEHPQIAASCSNVGMTYIALGDHNTALEYLLKALAIQEKALPPEHPNLATSYNNVGGTYLELNDHAKAMEYQLKALAICEKVLPPEHPLLARCYNNVGGTYMKLDDHTKGLEYMLKALATSEKALPPTHPDLARSCNNLAWTYYEMGDHETALKLMRRAADIAEQSLPEGHRDRVDYRRWAEDIERVIGEGRTSD